MYTELPAGKPRKIRCCPHCKKPLTSNMTEAEQLDAINRYIAGESLYGLSVRFDRGLTTIRRLMQRNGIRKKQQRT